MDAEAPIEEVVVEAEALRPEQGTAQVTVIEVDDRLPPSADVATAVQRAPGAVVQRLGGLGDWSSVSIRGSTARQVEVFLDGLPLNPEGAGVANLSELPLFALQQVRVYRGGAPLHLDTAAVGGAVDLITGERPGAQVAVSTGSWTTGRVSASALSGSRLGEWFVALDGLSTEGDFLWYDDGGTRTTEADDRVVRRDNNGTEQLALHARWRGGPEQARLTLFDAWLRRDEGVPGYAFDPTSAVAYAVDRHLPTAQLDLSDGALSGQLRLWGVTRTETLRDPLGELSRPAVDPLRTGAVGVRAQGTALLGSAVVQGMASVRDDRVDGASARRVLRAGAETTLRGESIVASATVRALGTETVRVVPRVGLGVVRPRVSVKISLGRSARVPDLTELYGDRGALVGNPELRDEVGMGGDLSVALSSDEGRLELGGFSQTVSDRIVWTRNAQGLAFPVNADLVTLSGAELGAGWRRGWVDLSANGTLTRAIDRSWGSPSEGRQLPGVPWVEGFGRAGLDVGWLAVSSDVSLTAGTFADALNTDLQPARSFVGATASVRDRRQVFALTLDVRNLLDHTVQSVPRDPLVDDGLQTPEPLVDFVGYPLPGRTVMVGVRGRWGE
jgi:iron complex outermembrane receptor protein